MNRGGLAKVEIRTLLRFLTSFILILASTITVLQPQVPAQAAVVDTSTVGQRFDFSLPEGPAWTGAHHAVAGWQVFFSSTETGTATVYWANGTVTNINLYGGKVESATVIAANMISASSSGVITSKVSYVTSTVGMSMYACDFVEAASDCTNLYPTPTWGTRYRLLYGKNSAQYGRIAVFSTSETATFTITPKNNLTMTTGSYVAGTSYNITIGPYQTWYSKTAATNQEISGTLITSTAKIGVINGLFCESAEVNFTGAGGACDTGAQFVPPTSSWGSSFYATNYRNTSTTGSGFRVLADQNNTTITIAGDESATVTLQAGDFYQLHAFKNTGSSPNKSISITSNNPVLVSHWMFAGAYSSLDGSDNGDQSMSYVTPYQQYMSKYVVVSPSDFIGSFLNIVVPASVATTIKVDGLVVDQSLFRTIAGSTWKSAQLQVRTGTHQLVASQAFGVEVYGIGYYDSYAYSGGQSTSDISSVSALQLTASSINGIVGQQSCLSVNVQDSYGAPVPGIRVDATSTGASGSQTLFGTADSSGIANICLTGSAVGTDTFVVSANGYTANATITWSLTAPVISYSPSVISIADNVAMRSLSPTNGGGTVDSWSVSPSLPAGLSINGATGVIAGTPTTITATDTYTVTATNTAGSATALVTIEVASATPPSISYSPSTFSLTLDSATATITPTVSGTFPTWSVSPAIASGLNFNTQNGTITGTPDRTQNSTSYTVTATNSSGSVSTTVSISVNPLKPTISYSPTTFTGYVGYVFPTLNPRNSGSPATAWTISPSLSAGLSFNTGTGAISGTPSSDSGATSFTIVATNAGGSDTSTISVQVLASAPAPILAISPSSISATVGVAISAVTPTNTGGPASTWTISPGLPSGLSFTSSSGRVSGTPSIASPLTTYSIIGSNSSGSDTATISIQVTLPPTPHISYPQASYSLLRGSAISAIQINNSGGAATSFAISPSLSTGLTFDSTIGQISGTPSVDAASRLYTVTATNLGGTDTTTVTLSVSGPMPPDISYSPDSATVVQYSPIAAMVATNIGGSLTSYSVSPSLPNGISLNTSTGRISGSPTVSLSRTSYIVTATGDAGTDTATVTFTVTSLPLPSISPKSSTVNLTTGDVLSPVSFVNSGGTISSWSISPTVSNGITFDASTGQVSGTVTGTLTQTNFVVTATNGAGIDTATVQVTVSAAATPSSGNSSTASAELPIPQKSRVISILPSHGMPGEKVTIAGNFVEKISNIAFSGSNLAESSWLQTSTQIVFTVPQISSGFKSVQLFNGSTPALDLLGFTVDEAQKSSPTSKNVVVAPQPQTIFSSIFHSYFIGDINQQASVVATSAIDLIEIIGPGIQLALKSGTPSYTTANLSANVPMLTFQGARLGLKGIGFLANSELQIFIYSDPQVLQKISVSRSGQVDTQFSIPGTIGSGIHTIQVVSKASSTTLRTFNFTIDVEAKPSAVSQSTEKSDALSELAEITKSSKAPAVRKTVILFFKYNKFSILPFHLKQLSRVNPRRDEKVLITGFAQPTSPWADKDISRLRAATTIKALSANIPGVELVGRSLGSIKNPLCLSNKNRCAIIQILKK